MKPATTTTIFALATLVIVAHSPLALAQCPSSWQPGIGVPGLNEQTFAVAVMPNGDVIAGGTFSLAGGVPANRIARWNGAAWSALGSGVNSTVRALVVMPNGDLVAAGEFTVAGGVAANRVARWNGTAWSALGTGLNASTQTLALLPNGMGGGDLIAGGNFSTAGGVPASSIARWNGVAWSALGAGLNGAVAALAVLPNGSGGSNLFAGGVFSASGAIAASNVARWNGTAWSAVGSGTNNMVLALAGRPNGVGGTDLVAGGFFTSAGSVSANYVGSWNGTAWSALGTGASYIVTSLAVLPNPTGPASVIVAGPYSVAGGIPVWGVGRWNGLTWSALGGYTDQRINAMAVRPDGVGGGDLYMAGDFVEAGSGLPQSPTAANRVAKYRFGASGPGISAQPQSLEACAAGSATFSVAASGVGPFTYLWRKGTVTINSTQNPSAATAALTLSNIQPGDAATYRCVVTAACGSATSNAATLTITNCSSNCALADVASDSLDTTRNPNGAIGPEDLDAFIAAFIASNATIADVASDSLDTTYNPNGFVGSEDLDAFISSFIAGC